MWKHVWEEPATAVERAVTRPTRSADSDVVKENETFWMWAGVGGVVVVGVGGLGIVAYWGTCAGWKSACVKLTMTTSPASPISRTCKYAP